jgi:hypothetical protein
VSYGPTFADQFRQAVTYVDKIFKGDSSAPWPAASSPRRSPPWRSRHASRSRI